MTTSTLSYRIHCKYSGVQIATLEYATVAGHMPYLSHWDNMTALHPVFSLSTSKLLAFSRAEWNRLARAAVNDETTDAETTMLQVCYLAVLHSLGSIKQEASALPPLYVVQSTINTLFDLAYWHHNLASQRFKFPEYKLNSLNANTKFESIRYYLDACIDVRADYEAGVSDLVEKEKIRIAEATLISLRNSWIVPTSNKQLWNWVHANLPERYKGDIWMQAIFCGTEKTVLSYDKDEIELMTEIIEGECPAGSGIMHAVRVRLEAITAMWTEHKEAFTVDFTEYLPADETDTILMQAFPQQPPQEKDFLSKVAYIKARAKYYLQQRAKAMKSTGDIL
jgi:hypothetical protein